MDGFSQIIEAISNYIDLAKFWTVVNAYEEAVVLRFGLYNRTLQPGLRFLWPFAEVVLRDNVVPATFHVGPISLTTKDHKSIVVSGVVTWSIEDIETFLLGVEDAQSVIEDSSYGIIGEMVRAHTWEQIIDEQGAFTADVRKKLRYTMKKFGVKLNNFSFGDLSRSRSLRIIGGLEMHGG